MSLANARRVSATVWRRAKKLLYEASCFGLRGGSRFPGIVGGSRRGRAAGDGIGAAAPVLRWAGGKDRRGSGAEEWVDGTDSGDGWG